MTPKKQKLFDECSDFQNVIAYRPVYTKICGSLTVGVLLSQLVYWARICKWKEFYKEDKETIQETGLTYSELKAAKRNLKILGYFFIKAKGMPVKTFYMINIEKIIKAIQIFIKQENAIGRNSTNCKAKNDKLKVEIQPNDGRKTENIHTENTTEKIYRIFDYWNAKKITVHRQKAQWKSCIKLALKDYSEKEICQAIDNYSEILNSSLHFWDHKWTLAQFLNGKGNIDRFLDRDQALKSFAKNNNRHKTQGEMNSGKSGKMVI